LDSRALFTDTIAMLERVLDFRSQKHKLIVSNIANLDTPRYQAFDLVFEDQLKEALNEAGSADVKISDKGHFPIGIQQDIHLIRPRIVSSPSINLSNDLNTVDIEKEMGKLVENNLMYNVAVQIIGKKFEGIKNAIKEGGR